MAIGKRGETLQVVEINEDTLIGVITNQGGPNSLVTLIDDGNITFHFPVGDKIIEAVSAGTSFVAGQRCTGITSTDNVILS